MQGGRHASEGARPIADGPLMMVSKRRTADRALSGPGSVPSAGPAHSVTRHSHDQRYASQHSRSYDIHADIASVADHTQRQQPKAEAQHQQRPRRHQRSSHADQVTLHPISPIPGAFTVIDTFEKPRTKHIESLVTGHHSTSAIEDDDEDNEAPLTPPPPRSSWHRHASPSTPPITIPTKSPAAMQHASSVSGSAASSSGNSSSAPRSASPARALGFAAHLGMTSISGPSTSAISDSRSMSTSDPTSEGSSRMSSFSEHNGLQGASKHSLKRVTEEDSLNEEGMMVRPTAATTKIRKHRTSVGGATAAQGQRVSSCAIEDAIGTLRRMTISGEETGIFGALDHH